MTSDEIKQARAAWERLDAACAGLLASKCKRHPPYMGCAINCGDITNALAPEHAEAAPLITAALDALEQERREVERLRRELGQRNRSIVALNAHLKWCATNACSGEDTCWCDAHEAQRRTEATR